MQNWDKFYRPDEPWEKDLDRGIFWYLQFLGKFLILAILRWRIL